MKPKRKGLSAKKILFLFVLIIVIVWGIYSVLSKPVELKSSDFLIVSQSQTCGVSKKTGGPSLLIGFNLVNNLNAPFHYVSANVILVHFTLSNRTVVSVNEQIVENEATFATQHVISVQFNLPNLPSNITVVQAEFTITAHIQEVSNPIVLSVPNAPIRPCST